MKMKIGKRTGRLYVLRVVLNMNTNEILASPTGRNFASITRYKDGIASDPFSVHSGFAALKNGVVELGYKK